MDEELKWMYDRDNSFLVLARLACLVREIIHTSCCSNVLWFAGAHEAETPGGGENRANTWYQNNPRSSRPRRASSILSGSAAAGDTATHRHAICPQPDLDPRTVYYIYKSSVVRCPAEPLASGVGMHNFNGRDIRRRRKRVGSEGCTDSPKIKRDFLSATVWISSSAKIID